MSCLFVINDAPYENERPYHARRHAMNRIKREGSGLLDPWLDLTMLALSGLLFLWPSVKMYQRARVLGR